MFSLVTSSNHPIILKSLLTNKTAIPKSEASFHCHVTSDSVTYVRWYFQRNRIQVNTSSNSTHDDIIQIKSISPVKILSFMDSCYNGPSLKGEAVFLVQNISFKDEGEYICKAFNERGKTKFRAFLAVVKGNFFFAIFAFSNCSPQKYKVKSCCTYAGHISRLSGTSYV